jgi:hypothetical protein
MPSPRPNPRPRAPGTTALTLSGEEASAETGHSKILRSLAKLMADIAEARQRIVRNEALAQDLIDRLEKELRPLENQYLEARIETLRVLGACLKQPWLKKRDAKRLREALCELADELEEVFGADLEIERTTLLGQEFMSEAEEREFDAMQEMIQAKMDAFFNNAASGSRPGGNSGGPESRVDEPSLPDPEEGPKRRRKAGSGPNAKGAAKAREEEAMAGDIRALYLLLARALHPDKETDEERRREKTAWMQKVTAAYGERKLADLLDIMARNPLDSVGPYLSQAPLKTVQGFAKRLRRELTLLRRQADEPRHGLPPEIRSLLGPEGVNEKAFKTHLAGARKQVKFVKARLESYRDRAMVEELVVILRKYDWPGLM